MVLFIYIFTNSINAFSQIQSFNITASNNSYMLSDEDYIFIDLINDSRIDINIKHINQNKNKSQICKIISNSGYRIFLNLNLKMLPDCLKDSLFSYLIFEINGVENKEINFKLKSIFKKKKEIKKTSDKAIIIPYSNFYLIFNKPNLHEYKIGYRNTNDINFNNHNVFYNSDIYNLKILPTFIYHKENDYYQKLYDNIIKSLNNFQDFDLIMDFDLVSNLEDYEKIIFPYAQEHLDILLFQKIFDRLQNKNLKTINLLSLGPSLLYGMEIDPNEKFIKIIRENYGLFEFYKNYCLSDIVTSHLNGSKNICIDGKYTINNIGSYIKVNENLDAQKLYPFSINGNISYNLYELNFPNGKILQMSNDYMSLNFHKDPEIKEKIENFID